MKMLNIKNIKEALDGSEGSVILFKVDAKEYLNTKITILKEIVRDDAATVYVSLNRPCSVLIETFKKNKINIDKIFFIDCITKAVGEAEETKNVVFIDGPKHLTNLSITIIEAIKTLPFKNKFLVLDALTTLLIYNSPEIVLGFLNSMSNKMRILKVNSIWLSAEKELDPKIESRLDQFIDKVVDLIEKEEKGIGAEELIKAGFIKKRGE